MHPPLAPVLSGQLWGRQAADLPSVLEAGNAVRVTSARIALGMALESMGIGAGDEVLLPAYHSPSMVAPVVWSQATPVFYDVGAGAMLDVAALNAVASARTRLLVVTHYFGFHQDLPRLRAWCDERGIALLEDCAHAMFGALNGRPLGAYGDYAIVSSMKFHPVVDGGALVSARHRLDRARLRGGGPGFELKTLFNTLERARAHGRLGLFGSVLGLPLRLKDAAWRMLKQRRRQAAGEARLAPASSNSGTAFEPAWLHVRQSRASVLLESWLSPRQLVERRRRHYQQLKSGLAGLAGMRPLFPGLEPGTCPWMLPMWVDAPEPVVQRLLDAGVPMTRFALERWATLPLGRFPNSDALACHVIAFPCHQALREEELDWMIATIRASWPC
jgi:dTDP-4-amino-4,6-dideoxygalactose transaminase